MQTLYSLLMWLAQPLLRYRIKRRGRCESVYLQAVEERFGRYGQPVPVHPGPTVWLHAVSLGEVRAASVLLAALRAALPGMRLLLTHGTATGRTEGVKLLQAGDLQVWQPWDTRAATRSFVRHFKPDIGILMETEVWPNLVASCWAQQVPLVLVNARLSLRSLRKAQRLAWLATTTYARLRAVWPQTSLDGQRLAALSAPVREALGNLKFDLTPDAAQLSQARRWRQHQSRAILMLASSRDKEELALLQAIKKLGPSDVQWLIVPRHPQRFAAVADMIKAAGFALSRRSSWGQNGPEAPAGDSQLPVIWLGDSLGEMALYFGLADVALLGGSFAPLGGQNLIEAAACGCPVVMGWHTFNFAFACEQALALGAAKRAADLEQAIGLAVDWLAQPAQLAQARLASFEFASAHRGAAKRLAAAIVQELPAQLRP